MPVISILLGGPLMVAPRVGQKEESANRASCWVRKWARESVSAKEAPFAS